MTTTPTTPSIFPSWIHALEAFYKAHERLILIGAASTLLFYFGSKIVGEAHTYLDNKHTEAQASINLQIAQLDTQNKNVTVQLAQMRQDYDIKITSLQAQIAKSKQTVIIKQKQDAVLPLPQLAVEWQSMLLLPEGSITPKPDGTLAVTGDAAHKTVNELDKVGPLTDQLVATTQEFESCKSLSLQKDVAIKTANDGWTEEKKGRTADAKVAKDNERKIAVRWFKRGFIAGAAVVTAVVVAVLVH